MLKFINFSIKFMIIFLIVVVFFMLSTLWYFSIGLPDYKKLSNYQPLFQVEYILMMEN